jgi:hypothetical protein
MFIGVHFGADAAGSGTGFCVLRPELFVGETLGQVFGDGQRVPHREVAVDQHRHTPRRADARQFGLELRPGRKSVEAQLDLFERNAGLLEQHPRAHRPRRIILVADVEFHGRLVRFKSGMLTGRLRVMLDVCACD